MNYNFDNAVIKSDQISPKIIRGDETIKKNDVIVIKEAGKGGAVVVMNNADYMVVKINHDQIKIIKTLKIVTTYFSKTLRIFEKFSSFLLKEQKKFLAKFLFSKNNFYSLLKVHKSKTIYI